VKAYVHLRDNVHYRLEGFVEGLKRIGYEVLIGQPARPLEPNDVAVIWNKTARSGACIEAARRGGGAIIVAENGYHGWDAEGRQTYAMALDGHNGSGRWFAGDRTRLDALGIEFQPWKELRRENKVVIAAQRGIGAPQMASPHAFAEGIADQIRRVGWQPYIRQHPGRHKSETTLAQDLEDARALVVWSSNCATEALIRGIPVFYCAPNIVTSAAATRWSPGGLPAPPMPEREPAFERMAWAQWFVDEIESGEAMRTLLDVHAGRLPACQEGMGL